METLTLEEEMRFDRQKVKSEASEELKDPSKKQILSQVLECSKRMKMAYESYQSEKVRR